MTDIDHPLMGHVYVDRLMKRYRLVTTTLDGETIDSSWVDQAPAMWGQVCESVGGRTVDQQHATRSELWTACQALVGWLDKRSPRDDPYPTGWQDAVRMVRTRGRPDAVLSERNPERERVDALETIRYLASLRARPPAELLAELDVTERTITQDDKARAIDLWGAQ